MQIPRKSKLKVHRELLNNQGILIRHFAGAVCYKTDNFLEKNNDALHASLESAISGSRNQLIQAFFADSSTGQRKPGAGRLNFISLGSKFRTQLSTLLEKLYSTVSYTCQNALRLVDWASGTSFIRCIKPNSHMVAREFEGSSCLSQLQCSGMTDVLSVMEQGFPSRTHFAELYNLYKGKMSAKLARLEPRVFCKLLFKALGLSDADFKFGTTRVFFRPGKFAEFDQLLQSDPAHLAALVQQVQRWLIRYRWKLAIYGALEVIMLKNKILWKRAMYVRIQKHMRGYLVRKRQSHQVKAMMHTQSMLKQLSYMAKAYQQMKSHVGKTGLAEVDTVGRKIQAFRLEMIQDRYAGHKHVATVRAKCEALQQEIIRSQEQLRKATELDRNAQQQARIAAQQAQMQREKLEAEEKAARQASQERHMREEIEKRRREEQDQFKMRQQQMMNAMPPRPDDELAHSRTAYQ
ncbi:Unconventional myosin-VI, partial [Cichlidogyrus casuarinus]